MRSPEEEAIVEVIEAANRTFWTRDFAAYERVYLHSPDQLLWGYREGGGFVIRRDWDEIAARSLEHMRLFPDPIPELAEAPMSKLTLRVIGKMAWATYDREYPFVPAIRGRGPNSTLHNLRILEKHDGRWLIVAAGLLDPNLGGEVAVRVGKEGEILWQSAAAALRLGTTNILTCARAAFALSTAGSICGCATRSTGRWRPTSG